MSCHDLTYFLEHESGLGIIDTSLFLQMAKSSYVHNLLIAFCLCFEILILRITSQDDQSFHGSLNCGKKKIYVFKQNKNHS